MRHFRPLIAVVAVALAAWKPEAPLAPGCSIASPAQVFTVGDLDTAASAMVLTCLADSVFNTVGGIQIIIPTVSIPPLNCEWKNTVTNPSMVIGGVAGPGTVDPVVTYNGTNKIVTIKVTADFKAGQTITVSNLMFTKFTAATSTSVLGLDVDNNGVADVVDTGTKKIGAPTMISNASQVFHVSGPVTAISPIVVTDDAVNPRINATNKIRVHIPLAFPMSWNTGDNVAACSGSAVTNGKIAAAPTVSFEDTGSRTLVIPLIGASVFAAGESVTIDGLSFSSPTAAAGAVSMFLDTSNTDAPAFTDTRTLTVTPAPTVSSFANQTFHVNDPITAIQAITVTDNATTAVITAAGDIRLRIPAGLNMTWDAIDTSASCAGTAVTNGRLVGAPTVTYEPYNAVPNKVVVIPVGTTFLPGEAVTITGLSFSTFSAASGATPLELVVDGAPTSSTADLDDKTVNILAAATIVSGANQIFRTNDPSTPISQIVVTDAATTASITAAGDIRIRIPAGLNMMWDTSDAIAACTGNAVTNGRITTAPTVTFEASNKVVVIPVGASFAASETVTITGLSFIGFTGAATGSLELVISGSPTGPTASVDTKTIQIAAPPTMASSGPQVFTVGDPSLIMTTITITEAAVPSITTATGIKITIPPSFPMTWDKGFATAVLGGNAAGRVSATVTFTDLDHTAVFTVSQNFAAGEILTITGLSFANFTGGASADFLTLNSDADAAADATDTAAKSIGAPTILSGTDQLFREQDPPEPIAPITIADGPIPRIKAATDIRIRIPAGFPMTFLTTDTTCTITGTAAGKVLATVAYEDGGMTAVLDVTNDFAASQDIIVSGLSFANFTKATAPEHLELEVNNLGTAADEDALTIAIYAIGGSAQDGSVCAAGGSAALGLALLLGLAAIAFRRV